jgi:hypothetical protein
MSLKEFLDEKTSLVDRIDRTLYSGSLIDAAWNEHRKTGKTIQAVTKKCERFFESIPKFTEWVKMSDKETFENEIRKIYMEQNK